MHRHRLSVPRKGVGLRTGHTSIMLPVTAVSCLALEAAVLLVDWRPNLGTRVQVHSVEISVLVELSAHDVGTMPLPVAGAAHFATWLAPLSR